MEGEFRLAPGAGVGDDANQGAGLGVEAGAGPQRAEHGLLHEVEKLLHDRIAVDAARRLLDLGITHQLPPHRIALAIELAFGHLGLLAEVSSRPSCRAGPDAGNRLRLWPFTLRWCYLAP